MIELPRKVCLCGHGEHDHYKPDEGKNRRCAWGDCASYDETVIWWRYAVLRGADLPVGIDGKWFTVEDHGGVGRPSTPGELIFRATHEWEVNDSGDVAVVYRKPEL